jgi:hypothetical protein
MNPQSALAGGEVEAVQIACPYRTRSVTLRFYDWPKAMFWNKILAGPYLLPNVGLNPTDAVDLAPLPGLRNRTCHLTRFETFG